MTISLNVLGSSPWIDVTRTGLALLCVVCARLPSVYTTFHDVAAREKISWVFPRVSFRGEKGEGGGGGAFVSPLQNFSLPWNL